MSPGFHSSLRTVLLAVDRITASPSILLELAVPPFPGLFRDLA